MQTGYTDLEGAKKFLGDCSHETIYRRVRAGLLKKYKLGSKTLFRISELDALPTCAKVQPAGNDNAEPAAA